MKQWRCVWFGDAGDAVSEASQAVGSMAKVLCVLVMPGRFFILPCTNRIILPCCEKKCNRETAIFCKLYM